MKKFKSQFYSVFFDGIEKNINTTELAIRYNAIELTELLDLFKYGDTVSEFEFVDRICEYHSERNCLSESQSIFELLKEEFINNAPTNDYFSEYVTTQLYKTYEKGLSADILGKSLSKEQLIAKGFFTAENNRNISIEDVFILGMELLPRIDFVSGMNIVGAMLNIIEFKRHFLNGYSYFLLYRYITQTYDTEHNLKVDYNIIQKYKGLTSELFSLLDKKIIELLPTQYNTNSDIYQAITLYYSDKFVKDIAEQIANTELNDLKKNLQQSYDPDTLKKDILKSIEQIIEQGKSKLYREHLEYQTYNGRILPCGYTYHGYETAIKGDNPTLDKVFINAIVLNSKGNSLRESFRKMSASDVTTIGNFYKLELRRFTHKIFYHGILATNEFIQGYKNAIIKSVLKKMKIESDTEMEIYEGKTIEHNSPNQSEKIAWLFDLGITEYIVKHFNITDESKLAQILSSICSELNPKTTRKALNDIKNKTLKSPLNSINIEKNRLKRQELGLPKSTDS